MITGTRAEYGLLRPLIRAMQKSARLQPKVLVTGMHTLSKYGHTIDEIQRDKIHIAHVVAISEGDSMPQALAKEIKGIEWYCRKNRPDLIVVLGDRDESFAGAIVGGHLGIPVAHIHGGDKTGLIVDEYIRHATTKFSHLHFAATKTSARRIRLLGEEPGRVFVVGGPGLDDVRATKFLPKKIIAKYHELSPDSPWYVVLHHPASLDTTPFSQQIRSVLETMSVLKGEKIIVYPNSDAGSDVFLKEINRIKNRSDVHVFPNLSRAQFLNILKHSSLIIGNSSAGIIEAGYMRIPAVNVGLRQGMRERGTNVISCGYDKRSIGKAITRTTGKAFLKNLPRGAAVYGTGHAAEKIVRIIEKNIDRKDLFHKKLTYV